MRHGSLHPSGITWVRPGDWQKPAHLVPMETDTGTNQAIHASLFRDLQNKYVLSRRQKMAGSTTCGSLHGLRYCSWKRQSDLDSGVPDELNTIALL